MRLICIRWLKYILGVALCFGGSLAPVLATPREVWERYEIALVTPVPNNQELVPILAGVRQAAAALEKAYFLKLPVEMVPLSGDLAGAVPLPEGVDGLLLYAPTPSAEIRLRALPDLPTVRLHPFELDDPSVPTVPLDWAALATLAAEALDAQMNHWDRQVAVLVDPQNPQAADFVRQVETAFADRRPPLGVTETALDIDPTRVRQQLRAFAEADRDEVVDALIFQNDLALRAYEPLPWPQKRYEVVAVGGIMATLPYLARNEVEALVVPDYERWGATAVEQLIRAIHPPMAEDGDRFPLSAIGGRVVTREELPAYARQWSEWFAR